MSNGKLRVALIISLAFNVAVLGTLAIQWGRHVSIFRCIGICEGDRVGPFWGRHGRLGRHGHLGRRIGLSEKRARDFEQIMEGAGEEISKLKTDLRDARRDLMDLLSADEPDEGAIMEKIDEISAMQGELEKLLVGRILHTNSILNKEERLRLLKLIRCRMLPGHGDHGARMEYAPGRKEDGI